MVREIRTDDPNPPPKSLSTIIFEEIAQHWPEIEAKLDEAEMEEGSAGRPRQNETGDLSPTP